MAICQNIPPFRIDHEPCSLAGHGQLRVERRRLAEMNGHDGLDDHLDCLLPLRGVLCVGGEHVERGAAVHVHVVEVFGHAVGVEAVQKGGIIGTVVVAGAHVFGGWEGHGAAGVLAFRAVAGDVAVHGKGLGG